MDMTFERHTAKASSHATVSTGDGRVLSDSVMIVRNPAPDASPPSVPQGMSHSFKLGVLARL